MFKYRNTEIVLLVAIRGNLLFVICYCAALGLYSWLIQSTGPASHPGEEMQQLTAKLELLGWLARTGHSLIFLKLTILRN